MTAHTAHDLGVPADARRHARALRLLLALFKARYKRKIPTGKFRQTKSGKPGAQIFRYVYTNEAAARGAQEGEHVNFQRQGGVHEVTKVDHEGVTLKHAKSGQEKRLTHDEFHAHLANAYRREFDRGAEALIKRYVATAGKLGINLDPSDPKATLGELRERFKAAGVEPEHAKRLVTFLASRPGWHTDAKKALLTLASDPTVGKSIAPRAKQIARGAENLSRADGAGQVERRHVGRAIALRVPGGGFDEKLTDLRHRAAMELAHTEALLGAVEAASGNEAMKRVMVDHAEQAMKSDAGRELEQMVTAYPGLRDVPELQRLQVARAKWQALQTERGAQRTPGKDGIQGAATTVYVSDADGNPTPQKARYRLIEADAATASHDPIKGFAVRKDYPEGVQERSYHRDKAEQEKVRRNAQGLEPAYIVNTNPDAVNGPPVMTRDGIVLGGNSRTMSLQLAYHQHPDSAKGYRDYLREHAHEFGLAHTDLDGFKAPILVREVEVEDQGKANLGVLVRRYNESFTQGMDPRVDQVARGRMVTQGMLDSVASGMGRTNDSGEPLYGTLKEFLGSHDGMRFVSDLSSSREGKAIIDRRNRSQYVGKDGKLNEDGKTFVERVLVGHVIPDPDLLSDMLPKHVSAIAGAVPHVVSAAAKGHDVKAALKTAMDAHAYMRRKGLSDVGEYERDSGGFASLGIEGFEQKPKLDATSKGLLGVLVDRIDKPVQLAGFFREFAKQARANPAGQANLLGESADTATLLGQAAGRSKTGQVDMFSKAITHTWVGLSDSFGKKLWGTAVLAKGGAAPRKDGAETRRLPWWAALAFDPSGLFKAAPTKYIKRIPTGNPKRPWKYFYKVQHGGGVHGVHDFKEGATFADSQHGAGRGHYKIHGVQDGKLAVSHSSDPSKIEHVTHDELAKRLQAHHAQALGEHKTKLEREHAEARAAGNHKAAAKIREEAKRVGHEIKEPNEPKKTKPGKSSVSSGAAHIAELVNKPDVTAATAAHPKAVHLKDMDHEQDYRTWQRRGDGPWMIGRTYSGGNLQGADRIGTGRGAYGDTTVAAFDLDTDPNEPAKGAAPAPEKAAEPRHANGDAYDPWDGGAHPSKTKPSKTPDPKGKEPKPPAGPVEHSIDANSGNLSHTRWTPNGDGSSGTMRVRFKNGSEYDYHDVAFSDYEGVRAGAVNGSPGQSFNHLVKDKHKTTKVKAGAKGTPAGAGADADASNAKRDEAAKQARKEQVNERKESNSRPGATHTYGARRPIEYGSAPEGHVSRGKHDDFPHGTVSYDTELSDAERERYGLLKIPSEHDKHALAARVVDLAKDSKALPALHARGGSERVHNWLEAKAANIIEGSGIHAKSAEIAKLANEKLNERKAAPDWSEKNKSQPYDLSGAPGAGEKVRSGSETETSHPSHAERIETASSIYKLSGKEAERVKAHPYAQKAAEHAQAGDHDKAKGMVRAAVKDVLARSPERNMSPSSAERHMKESEARNGNATKRMGKALHTFVSLWKGARAA